MKTNNMEYEEKKFKINYNKVQKHTDMPMYHYHNSYEIYYLLSGERYYFIKDRTYHIIKGDLVFINIKDLHKTTSAGKSGYERILINFKKNFIQKLLDDSNCPNLLNIFNNKINILRLGTPEQNFVEQLLDKMLRQSKMKSCFTLLYEKALISELLIFMNRYKNPLTMNNFKDHSSIDEKIFEIVQYINNSFSEKLKLNTLSNLFYISPYYLCKMFKQVTGFTFTEYLNSVRIRESQKLLTETDLSITRIADKVGYESITHFGRVFRKVTGITPSEYRKKTIYNY